MDQQLLELSELYEKEETLKGEVTAAVAYPILVLVAGLISAGVLVAFFIPRIEDMFLGAGQALPLPTRILLALSHFITDHHRLILVGLVLVAVGLKLLTSGLATV